ncbi:anti-sigma factor [Aeromicrobium sp.]|uniref:anti-sigma factor family protein n=1 Tax=Aeromicrobium sp. TaxID=1871063 RepID=UPI0019BE476A|nr:zf-HC2 domain-containing protein [Aeromicrobium sp.]MBC7632768.1 zf-HC2 domain-containing protein [Aeromicrobium sp.]
MAHLGADVAAFVDGQLSVATMQDAEAHLESCDECRKAVRQQRMVKSRMSTVAAPEPPAALLASLAGLACAPPARDGWWSRLRRSTFFRAGFVLAGASFAVVVAAYAVGGADHRIGDQVSPPMDRYVTDFHGGTTVQAGNVISESTMSDLGGAGWPCHVTLAGSLRRTAASYTDHDEVVALTYSDGIAKLNLYEQSGALDREGLDGFRMARMGGSQVWVRDGDPMLVTWDDEGVVYTIVTDARRDRVARAVAELPKGAYDEGPVDRIGDGLTRMTAWADAA